jgi:hypothetical protein
MKVAFHRRLSRMAERIRKEGSIDRVNLCIKEDITQATLYNYKNFLLQLYPEITYENGVFVYHPDADPRK